MSSIDERIVDMKFRDGAFQAGIKRTLDGLSALKKGLNLDGAKKSLDELDQAGKKFNLDGLATHVQGASAKFLALATIGITALTNIANRAIDAGATLVRSLTIDPVKTGLQEYETQLNSIQTILSNTQSKGTNLDQVNAALQELNTYADKTIYNFSEMTRNIGTFTAAGVDLNTSVAAIKGIANLAAVSGSSSQQASTAMYQLSQALATGTVKLMDWNSVVNAGMGGEVFQNAIKETARAHGVAVDDIITKNGSFRDSLQEGWLTSDIMLETLNKFTGDLTAEQLKSMGYTEEQIAGIVQMGQTAQDAATKVKTVTQLIDTLREAAGSGWAQTWQIIFGDFEEARTLFTSVSDVLGGIIGESANARNQVLSDWKELGGRTAIIEAIKNAFDAVMQVVGLFKSAMRDIFPPVTGQQLADLSAKIRDFTAGLTMGSETANQVSRIFKGFFAALSIGVSIVKGIASVIGDLFSEVGKGTGGFLDFSAGVGDWLVRLDEAIKKGEGFKDFFSDLGRFLSAPITLLRELAGWIGSLFSDRIVGHNAPALALERLSDRLQPLGALASVVGRAFGALGDLVSRMWDAFAPLAAEMGAFFGNLGNLIAESIQTGNFDSVLDAVNTGLFAALILAVKKFLDGGINVDMGGGLVESIKGVFGGLTDTLSAMQAQIKSGTLLKIATAIGILTASVVALSLIDSENLTKALTAMAVMFLQLAGAAALLDVAVKSGGFAKLPGIALALIGLSIAIGILAPAVKSLSELSWEELGKGLAAVAALMGTLAGTAKLLSANSGGLITAGIGMIAVATAVKILASAVEQFAGMDWGSMAKGLTGVGATLAALGLFTKFADAGKMGLSSGAGLLLLAASLKIIASAVSDFGSMNLETLGKGLGAMAISLGLITAAMNLLPKGMIVQAAGLVIVAGALLLIGQTVQQLGGMSWEEIAKGLVALAGGLAIITVALYAMSGTLLGSAALIVAAGAIALLAPALVALGGMSWAEIGMGMAALAAALTVLGVASALLTPVIPSMLGLGVAIGLIGVGVAGVGIGVLALSAGLTALSVSGVAGAAALTAVGGAIIGLIPAAIEAIGQGLVLLAQVIYNAAPTFLQAMTAVIMTLLQAIQTVSPEIINTVVNLLLNLVDAIARAVPQIASAALRLITGLLNAIASGLPGVITAGTNVIIAFIRGIASNAARLADAGMQTIIQFVNSLAASIDRNAAAMRAAGQNLARAIIDGMTGGLASGVGQIVNKAKEVAQGALNAAKKLLGINSPSKEFTKIGAWSSEGLGNGLIKMAGYVARSAEKVGDTALSSMSKSLSGVSALIESDLEMTPTIRPVLDLSDIQTGASKLNTLLTPSSITPDASYSKASSIARDNRATERAMAESQFGAGGDSYTFVQNNSSPKALSPTEIYRQTNNQLSVLKKKGD